MSGQEILHYDILPMEMKSPPYGATISVHEDHSVVELPYVQSPIFVLPGERVNIGLTYNEAGRIVLAVTREKIA